MGVSRVRLPIAEAAPEWIPSVGDRVEAYQDDVLWEAEVLEVSRTRKSSLLRMRVSWEQVWVPMASLRPSPTHRECMRSGVVLAAWETAVFPFAAPTSAGGGHAADDAGDRKRLAPAVPPLGGSARKSARTADGNKAEQPTADAPALHTVAGQHDADSVA